MALKIQFCIIKSESKIESLIRTINLKCATIFKSTLWNTGIICATRYMFAIVLSGWSEGKDASADIAIPDKRRLGAFHLLAALPPGYHRWRS